MALQRTKTLKRLFKDCSILRERKGIIFLGLKCIPTLGTGLADFANYTDQMLKES